MKSAKRPRIQSSSAAGFSLVELLVTVIVVAEILILAGLMFDLNNRTARAQNQVSDMQQSLRVGQREMIEVIRMAGRGGLPAQLPADAPGGVASVDQGLAIEVDNNVGDAFQIDSDDPSTVVVPGTDVLRVRGVFNAPLYQLVSSALAGNNLAYLNDPEDPTTAVSGTIVVRNPSPSGFSQDLQPLLSAPAGSALLLVSPLSDSVYAVVSKTGASDVVTVDGVEQTTVSFSVPQNATEPYRRLYPATGNLPGNLTAAAFLGLLEEHVFYVREVFSIPGDESSQPAHRLSRGQVFPGTQTAIATGAARIDLADNVLDLQVALGFNSDADGEFFTPDQLGELKLTETANGEADDWLFNGPSDDPEEEPWVGGNPPALPRPELYYVRLTTLVRTEGQEFSYVSPAIRGIEDHAYNEAVRPAGREADREFHRRLLRTVVDLRNL